MTRATNRRKAPRLRCRVTVRFGEDSKGNEPTSEGHMLDIASGGLAFRCKADKNCPHEGKQLITHFSIPKSDGHDSAAMMKFTRSGRVLRVQEVNSVLRNVAVRFDEPLSVGKVFFHNIGLYLPNPESQTISDDDKTGVSTPGPLPEDGDPFMESMLEQRINELEQELAELKRFQFLHTPPNTTE
jgi:hypothetical protein